MRTSQQQTPKEMLRYFKHGDGIDIEYFDLEGNRQHIKGVIREISKEEIVLWGDPVTQEPDIRVALNRVYKIDFPEPDGQVADAGKDIVKTIGVLAIVVGVLALTIYVVQKNADGSSDGRTGDIIIDTILGNSNRSEKAPIH